MSTWRYSCSADNPTKITRDEILKFLDLAGIEALPWQISMLIQILNHRGPIGVSNAFSRTS